MGEVMIEPELEVVKPIELSGDEITILSIAARGESLAAIARWKQPIDSLLAKGLLERRDRFNNVITEAGKRAVAIQDQKEEKQLETIAEMATRSTIMQVEMRHHVSEAVSHLVAAVQLAKQARGDSVSFALTEWTRVIVREAAAQLDG